MHLRFDSRLRRAAVLASAVAVAGLVLLAGGPSDAAPPSIVLRIATQAPEGTVWMDALKDIRDEVKRGTRDRVELQYFPNGSQGDEKAVIERMQVGLLHGGLFTGIGLGEILPKIRVLEMPFLYENKDEIDAVKTALEPEFKAGFEEKGFVFLGWSEVGWAYIFSKNESRNITKNYQSMSIPKRVQRQMGILRVSNQKSLFKVFPMESLLLRTKRKHRKR